VFDLDGTLIRGASACELLAQGLGRSERMRQFEGLKTVAEIAQARAEMLAWYAEASSEKLLAFLDTACWAPGAREAVALLKAEGYVCGISSMTWRFAVQRFAEHLGIEHYQGTTLAPDGSIEHVWPEDKPGWVTALAARLGFNREQVITVGDSWRDIYLFGAGARAFFVGPASAAIGLPEFVSVVAEADLLLLARRLLAEVNPSFEPLAMAALAG
jgi:HAD superfamily phosphoserine phosphatase-like hydrolase